MDIYNQNVSKHDRDVVLASYISKMFDEQNGDYFLLTGSYSIESLSNRNTYHNDIDVNIFTKNIQKSIGRVATNLELIGMRLIRHDSNRIDCKKNESVVEMNFVQYDDIEVSNGLKFIIKKPNAKTSEIPTTIGLLSLSDDSTYEFRVKTLPFAIATWALRISNTALEQKRQVRESDLDNFATLTKLPYAKSQVVEAIAKHPQYPYDEEKNAGIILIDALNIISLREKYEK